MENNNQDERDESLNNSEDENQDESLNENLDGDNNREETQEEKDYRQIAENQKIRAEKAERESKKYKAQLEERQKNNKTNEPDYAKLAFLRSSGIEHPDDQTLIQEEAERLKLPLTDVMGMEHIKSKLKNNADQREAQSGLPRGRGATGKTTQADVDYWLAKGETPDDQEMAEKVIEAKMKKEHSSGKFSKELY